MVGFYERYPEEMRRRLLEVRRLIFQLAEHDTEIGVVTESMKWGQASFATTKPKSGTPIRIDGDEEEGTYSLYVPCSTSLIPDFRSLHPQMFSYHGNREIRLNLRESLPVQELSLFITAALTYYCD